MEFCILVTVSKHEKVTLKTENKLQATLVRDYDRATDWFAYRGEVWSY